MAKEVFSVNSIEKKDLVDRFGGKISQLSRRMIEDQDLAQDAAQEVWVEVFKSLSNFKNQSSLSTWIYQIAKRTILRYSGKEKTYSQETLISHFKEKPLVEPQSLGPYKSLWVKECCDRCLTAILHCLENEERLLFLFRDVIPLPYEELSTIFQEQSTVLRKRFSRSKKKIETYLNSQCPLINPQGACHCSNLKAVKEIDLPGEYAKMENLIQEMGNFQRLGHFLPQKNYWLEFL